jgi:Zn-dependent protease/predicted transcriptional regulator
MFANATKLCTINGFTIRVDPSWLVIAALVTWSLSQQYFPNVLPDAHPNTHMTMALAAMVCFFTSLLAHELAHCVVARRLGVPVKNITLFLFGGVAELETEPQSAVVEFWVALAGPAMSFTLAFGFWGLTIVAGAAPGADPVVLVLSYVALMNLILALFNLIPAFPLDGGRVLRAYLWHRSGNSLSATRTAAKSGGILGYVLIGLGVLALFRGALVAGLWQIMIGGFILMAARSSYQSHLARAAFDHKVVRDLMGRDPTTIGPEITLADYVNRTVLAQGVTFVPVVEDGVLLGHMDRNVLSGIDREHWGSTQVDDVFVGLNGENSTGPNVPIQDLMARISKTNRRKFMVVQNHNLIGVITLTDLIQYLQASERATDL